jgi:predicted ABC-type ATPase
MGKTEIVKEAIWHALNESLEEPSSGAARHLLPQAGEGFSEAGRGTASPLPLAGEGGRRAGEGTPDEGRPAKVVWILGGPNGAGKSTLAPSLIRDVLSLKDYVNADVIASGLSAFSPESVALSAGRIMLQRLREMVEADRSFAFETTLATKAYGRWTSELKAKGYAVHLVFLYLHSPDLELERVRQRVRMAGHNIPEADVRRRHFRGLQNLFQIYIPAVSTWCVVDNSEKAKLRTVAAGTPRVQDVFEEEIWQRMKAQANL